MVFCGLLFLSTRGLGFVRVAQPARAAMLLVERETPALGPKRPGAAAPGQGRCALTAGLPLRDRYVQMAQDVIKLLDTLGDPHASLAPRLPSHANRSLRGAAGIERCCVIGHSMGGKVTQPAAVPPPYFCPYPCPYCILPTSLPPSTADLTRSTLRGTMHRRDAAPGSNKRAGAQVAATLALLHPTRVESVAILDIAPADYAGRCGSAWV